MSQYLHHPTYLVFSIHCLCCLFYSLSLFSLSFIVLVVAPIHCPCRHSHSLSLLSLPFIVLVVTAIHCPCCNSLSLSLLSLPLQVSSYYKMRTPFFSPKRNHFAEIWYRDTIWHSILVYQSNYLSSLSNQIYRGSIRLFPLNVITFLNWVGCGVAKIALESQHEMPKAIFMPNFRQFGKVVSSGMMVRVKNG